MIPDATQKIWEQLGQSGKLADVRIDELQWGGLEAGNANREAGGGVSARGEKRSIGKD